MTETITGGCLCGATRFRYAGEVGGAGYCHCTDCRRVTGSAFNVSVGLDAARFDIVAGAPKGHAKYAESGHELTRWFCPDCGSSLYTASPVHPDTVYVKAGAFDDPTVVRPTHQSWTRSAVEWARIDPDLPGFEADRRG